MTNQSSSSKLNSRPISDFPELLEPKNLEYRLKFSYFKEGLDASISIDLSKNPQHIYNFITQNRKYKNERQILTQLPILYKLFYMHAQSYIEVDKEEIISYLKSQLPLLHKEKKITQQTANDLAFLMLHVGSMPSLFEHLIKNKIVDINARTLYGHTFLMQVQDKTTIDMLVKLGIDVNATVSDKDSPYFGKTAYDIAVSLHKKGMISYLKPYMPETSVKEHESSLLDSFTKEVGAKKQMKIFMTSLKDGNQSIIDEITSSPEKYKDLIEYKDVHGKDLLRQCISNNAPDIALKVMQLNHYQKNKNSIVDSDSLQGDCYCSYAINTNKMGCAKVAFEQGFYVKSELIKFFEYDYPYHVAIPVFNLFLDTGYNPSLHIRWQNQATYKLDEKLQSMTSLEIEKFIHRISYMLDLSHTHVYSGTVFYTKERNNQKTVLGHHVRFFCKLLKALRPLNPDLFESMFKTYFKSLGQAPTKVLEYFSLVSLTQFPEDKNKILSLLPGDNPFVVKLMKNNLESVLTKFEAKEVKKFKI